MDVRQSFNGDTLTLTNEGGRIALDGDEVAQLVDWLAHDAELAGWMRVALAAVRQQARGE